MHSPDLQIERNYLTDFIVNNLNNKSSKTILRQADAGVRQVKRQFALKIMPHLKGDENEKTTDSRSKTTC